jgi:hypothetical protein
MQCHVHVVAQRGFGDMLFIFPDYCCNTRALQRRRRHNEIQICEPEDEVPAAIQNALVCILIAASRTCTLRGHDGREPLLRR